MILVDVSLTGGRGPAKQAYEFVTACKERGIPVFVLTDKLFALKLLDIGVTPDIVLDIALADGTERILSAYRATLPSISFDLLVRFGARTPGPSVCLELNKPYIIVDGGLPDIMEPMPSLYDEQAYRNACTYLLTTQFDWQPPSRLDLPNMQLCLYPMSQDTCTYIEELKKASIPSCKQQLASLLDPAVDLESSLVISLVFTGDFLVTKEDRVTYGGWLTARQYDQCIGFLYRLIHDLGSLQKLIVLLVDDALCELLTPLAKNYPTIALASPGASWSYKTEILMKAAADLTISRATNYQPYIALLAHGNTVTTAVPADGYMDEDTAAVQYATAGMTTNILYDAEDYVSQLLSFAEDDMRQQQISRQQLAVSQDMLREKNAVSLILDYYNSLTF